MECSDKHGKKTVFVWDYVADKPVDEKDMLNGSDRWKASERARWLSIRAEHTQLIAAGEGKMTELQRREYIGGV